jgi:uncharacterized protein with PQ loop repeat
MNTQLIFGVIGSILSVLSTLPQLFKSRKMHSTKDISLLMYIIRVLSSASWIAYGVILNGTLLVVEASVVCVLQFVMVLFILRDKFNPIVDVSNVEHSNYHS